MELQEVDYGIGGGGGAIMRVSLMPRTLTPCSDLICGITAPLRNSMKIPYT